MNKPTGHWTFGRRGGFCYDRELEALLALRDTDRAAWEALKPHVKIKLAMYEGRKASYEDSLREQQQALEAAA